MEKEIKLHTGVIVRGPKAENAISRAAWLQEGEEKFGKDEKNWKFQCPMCGHVASGKDFVAAGAEYFCAVQECIGRYTGKGSPKEGDSSGCNWAAYGLFGIPNDKGRIVIKKDGTGMEVFDFAEVES